MVFSQLRFNWTKEYYIYIYIYIYILKWKSAAEQDSQFEIKQSLFFLYQNIVRGVFIYW